MTGDINKIRNKIGMMLWDAGVNPISTWSGFNIIVDGTKVLVTIEEDGE